MRTAQEIFDIVTTGLLTQGKASESKDGGCAYRGEDGCKCAIGFLISDEQYRGCYEGLAVGALLTNHLLPTELDQEFMHHNPLIYRLQRLHDTKPADYWYDGLSAIAQSFGLKFNPPGK